MDGGGRPDGRNRRTRKHGRHRALELRGTGENANGPSSQKRSQVSRKNQNIIEYSFPPNDDWNNPSQRLRPAFRYLSDGVSPTCMRLNDDQDALVGTSSGLVFRYNLGENRVRPTYYACRDTSNVTADIVMSRTGLALTIFFPSFSARVSSEITLLGVCEIRRHR